MSPPVDTRLEEGTINTETETETDVVSDSSLIGDSASSPSTSLAPSASVSEMEAFSYYAGLPSRPKLVFRTGTTPWVDPTGPEEYPELKELKPVFGHKIATVWKNLGNKVYHYLDLLKIMWTSIDVVRFAKVGEAPGPVVLWIGVTPKSLSGNEAYTAGLGCLTLLEEFDITDVEVEFRESVYSQLAGPKLLDPVSDEDPTVSVRGPLTPVLGLQIAAKRTPSVEGTGGLFISEGGNSEKILFITARHVVFPPNEPNNNYAYKNRSQSRHEVILLGTKAFEKYVESIKANIESQQGKIEYYGDRLAELAERGARGDVAQTQELQRRVQFGLDEGKIAVGVLNEFLKDVTKNWANANQRVLGHIVCSPPLAHGVGVERYTEDYAVIELDRSKFDKSVFKGNVIDLGTKISRSGFKSKMYPRPEAGTTFKYPTDRLLKLQGVIPEDKLRHPDMLDKDGEPCLIVIKSGLTTGVTIGRASGVFSYVRKPSNETSMEWSILPYDNDAGVFSAPGDSGAIIVDGQGRIGGLLNGGTSKGEHPDITYATPFAWLFPRIQANGFPDAHLYPVMT